MLDKETLDSWYEPRKLDNLTEKEEETAEEIKCDLCEGTGEINGYSYDSDAHEYVWDGTRPCICQKDYELTD